MGIKGLLNLIKKNSNAQDMLQNVKDTNIKNYSNTVIAIDAEILIYKFSKAINGTNYEQSFELFINYSCQYLSNGILPVFVFDGKSPSLKYDVLDKRREIKILAENKINKQIEQFVELCKTTVASREAIDLYKIITKEQSSTPNVTWDYRDKCKIFLKKLGIPVVYALGEAETTCVELLVEGFVDLIYTDDSDVIPYLVKYFIKEPELRSRDFKILMTRREPNTEPILQEYSINNILDNFGLEPKQFIEMCILSGCDYCPKSSKLNYDPYEFVKQGQNIDIKKTFGPQYYDNFEASYTLFLDPVNSVSNINPFYLDISYDIVDIKECNIKLLLNYLNVVKIYNSNNNLENSTLIRNIEEKILCV